MREPVTGPAARTWVLGSVRFRLTALATFAVASILAVAGIVVVTAQRRALVHNVDTAMSQRADDIEAVLDEGSLPRSLSRSGEEGSFAQVVDADGRVVAASEGAAVDGALAPAPAGRETIRSFDALALDDDTFRVLSRRVDTPDGRFVVHVAHSVDDVKESVAVLMRSLLVGVPLVTGLLGALVWWLTGRALRPVEAIRREVAAIGATELHRRVPEPATRDEIARLAQTMNSMLARLEEANLRQQRFVADASHELRSPITRIRSALEVDLARHDIPSEQLRATHEEVLADALELQRLVDDLLHLARSDAGVAVLDARPVDLDDLVLREARRLRERNRVAVDVGSVSGAQVEGDAAELARVIRNLAENAERHARSTVSFGLAERDGRAVLTVTDDGPGIDAADSARIFERFTRLDSARTPERGGAGLGLAIVDEIVRRHRGTVQVDPDHSPGTCFVVTLPQSG